MSKNQPNVIATLTDIASDAKKLVSFVGTTITGYNKTAIALHQTACMTFFHTAQYGECHALNLFYQGLRVNDRTALRVWIGQHATFIDIANGSVRPWIKYNEKEGFSVIKGCEAHRKDMFTINEQVEGRTMLIGLKPFYEKNVKDKDALTLEALVSMLAKAAKSVTAKATAEGIELPAGVKSLVSSINRETAVELAALQRVEEAK